MQRWFLILFLLPLTGTSQNFSGVYNYAGDSVFNESVIPPLEARKLAYQALSKVLPPTYYMEQTDTSITISYCRSCLDFELAKLEELELIYSKEKYGYQYFKTHGPDSVAFHSVYGQPTTPDYDLNTLPKVMKTPNGILQVRIWFQDNWSDERLEKAKKGNAVKFELIKRWGMLRNSATIFSDHRRWSPSKWAWKWSELRPRETQGNKTEGAQSITMDYNFERLPYKSAWHDCAIFISSNEGRYVNSVDNAEKGNWEKHTPIENWLTPEFDRTLEIIVRTLGVKDY